MLTKLETWVVLVFLGVLIAGALLGEWRTARNLAHAVGQEEAGRVVTSPPQAERPVSADE